MNFKKEKGITLLSLVLTVIILMILVGVTVHFSTDAVKKANLEDIKTDMISIKTRAKILAEKYNFKDIEKLVGSAITEDEARKIGLQDEFVENNDKILKWSSSDLANQNLGAIEGDIYIVFYDLDNPNDCEVYYLEGYENMHSLTELQGL